MTTANERQVGGDHYRQTAAATKIRAFWMMVNKDGPVRYNGEKCWEWKKGHTKGAAPRRSFRLNCGPIPRGLFVCHHCDNPKCIRPNHLFLGTNDDNRQDSVNKMRHAHGERHGAAKLTDDQIEEIRRRYKRTSYLVSNKNQLSKEFGIHPEYLGLIIRNTYRKTKTHERK